MARIILVTGLAGAGRTTALKSLEDLGFEAIDNLPSHLLCELIDKDGKLTRDLAIGVDCRSHAFNLAALSDFYDRCASLTSVEIQMLFLDCDDDVLARRFTATRRRHPLAPHHAVADGIAEERALMMPLRAEADLMIDTSLLTPGDLRAMIESHFDDGLDHLLISILSFSYREGLPREADLVFDVRFLDNPYYDERLRPMTGADAPVKAYIEADSRFPQLVDNLEALVLPLLPAYREEGKSYLTIAFGCTGGRHRSIATAETFASRLNKKGWSVRIHHRDTPEANHADSHDLGKQGFVSGGGT